MIDARESENRVVAAVPAVDGGRRRRRALLRLDCDRKTDW